MSLIVLELRVATNKHARHDANHQDKKAVGVFYLSRVLKDKAPLLVSVL